MDRRQDVAPVLFKTAINLVVSVLCIFILAACQKGSYPDLVSLPTPASFSATTTQAVDMSVTAAPIAQKPTPSPGVDCRLADGQIFSESFFSEELGEDLHYQVYLPPCYHEDDEVYYPVTYLLHGLTFTEEQWPGLGVAEQMDALIAEGRITPFIIVMPREARFQLPPTSSFPKAVVKELIPNVDQNYRTLPEKSSRAIAGISRGAAWAVHLGFVYPQLFCRVGAHSLALFDYDASRLSFYLADNSSDDLPFFFIDIGRSDPERSSTQNFANQLNTSQIPHTWYLFLGGHTETYWSSHLALYLDWYAQDW